MRKPSSPAFFFLLLSFSLGGLPAQETDAGASASAVGEEKDWLEFYYENPTPDRFVPQMKDWASDGTLDNDHAKPALIAFASQLIRQNRERLGEWYADLDGLTPDQRQVLHTAMLFSRTEEADKMMRDVYGKSYDEQKRETEKILEMPLDKRATMDMLWGYFYATGSETAIRRIVTAFRFREATEKPPGVDVPEGYVPLYKELPHFALGSLLANAERHPRVVEILRELFEKGATLLPVEKDGIHEILSEIDPKTYPPKDAAKKAA